MPGQSSYCATKFAVRGFSESLAIELAHENIDVISVHLHPGGIRTNIARNSRTPHSASHQRVIDFFDKHTMPAEEAADKIVRAVERRRNRVVITPEARITDVIKRLYPPDPTRLASWAMRKSKLLP